MDNLTTDQLRAEANHHKARNHAKSALLRRMRRRLVEIAENIEDEGDRAYFGSTNDADELREFVETMTDWRWDEVMTKDEGMSDPFADLRAQILRAEKAEAKMEALNSAAHNIALENEILSVLASYPAVEGELCLSFGRFDSLGLHREVLRGLMRSLKEQGLVEYYRGLTTEDGEFCGAGYSLTRAGYSRALEARQ